MHSIYHPDTHAQYLASLKVPLTTRLPFAPVTHTLHTLGQEGYTAVTQSNAYTPDAPGYAPTDAPSSSVHLPSGVCPGMQYLVHQLVTAPSAAAVDAAWHLLELARLDGLRRVQEEGRGVHWEWEGFWGVVRGVYEGRRKRM